MLGILAILLIAVYVIFFFPIFTPKNENEDAPKSEKYDAQMKKLWSIAQTSMKEKKTMRAEAALLTILKFDEKNAAAYNRLGILYAREQNYDEAIECFEIAQSLDNNASSLHNVGLIYLDTGEYEKASMAFRQALELEDDMPARYIALAKAEEKLGRRKAAVEALEAAYNLDGSLSTLRQILTIYEDAEDGVGIETTTARIEKQIAAENLRKEREAKAKDRPAKRLIRREPKIFYPKSKEPKKKVPPKHASKRAQSIRKKRMIQ